MFQGAPEQLLLGSVFCVSVRFSRFIVLFISSAWQLCPLLTGLLKSPAVIVELSISPFNCQFLLHRFRWSVIRWVNVYNCYFFCCIEPFINI